MIVARKYGWKPDRPDARDLLYAAPRGIKRKLPPIVDLRSDCPGILDQGELGSCTACAVGNAYEFVRLAQGQSPFDVSVLYVYYNTRVIEGTVDYDSGAELRNAIKAVARSGAASDRTWPYEVRKFTAEPSQAAYNEGSDHQALKYRRISPSLKNLKSRLADGFPFVFGFTVYESFESRAVEKSGVMPMPKRNERALGGHAVLAVGYQERRKRFTVMNSWSEDWGDGGYFYMPFEFITNPNYADDFWSIDLVE
ncbi:MAG: C1 family peptidase [Pirellulales bacterium]